MSKFSGIIGYSKTDETSPGIYEEVIIEKYHKGDILSTSYKNQENGKIISDVDISNRISIVADNYSTENFLYMKYAIILGIKWQINTVEIKWPRIILYLGNVYNENTTGTIDIT